MYRRRKIQEERLYYEHKEQDGFLPLAGVNTFLPKEHAGELVTEIELIRSTKKRGKQIENGMRWVGVRAEYVVGNFSADTRAVAEKSSRGLNERT